MIDDDLLRLRRVLARVQAHVDLRSRPRHDGVDRLVDRWRVDADDRDRRARPDPRRQPARPHQRQVVRDLGELAELGLVGVAVGPVLAPQARHGDVAVGVVQCRQRVQQHEQRVGRRAAVHAAVLCGRQRADLGEQVGQAAQRDGQRRHAGAHTARVGDQHRVAGDKLRMRAQVVVDAAAADLLEALDDQRMPTGGRPPQTRSAATCAAMLAFESAAPRPNNAPSRRVGSNGRRVPLALVAGPDDVVVAVQQDGRRAGRGGDLADHDRARVGDVEGRTSTPASANSSATRSPACAIGSAGRPDRDRRDSHECLEPSSTAVPGRRRRRRSRRRVMAMDRSTGARRGGGELSEWRTAGSRPDGGVQRRGVRDRDHAARAGHQHPRGPSSTICGTRSSTSGRPTSAT